MSGRTKFGTPHGPHPIFSSDDDEVVWVSDFDDEALESFHRTFSRLEADESISVIPVIISSYGGDVTALLGMRDLIKSSPKPVATIALGKAMSAGAALLAAGTRTLRFASPNTIVMIHEVQAGAQGRAADLVHEAVSVQTMNDQLFRLLAEDSGQNVDKFLKEIKKRAHANWYLTAYEAQALGLVDHVGVPRVLPSGVTSELVQVRPFKLPQETKKGKKSDV